MTSRALARRLGGRKTLERDVRTDLDLVEVMERGLPLGAVDAVVDAGTVTLPEIHALVIPRRTLAHRREKGQVLTVDLPSCFFAHASSNSNRRIRSPSGRSVSAQRGGCP